MVKEPDGLKRLVARKKAHVSAIQVTKDNMVELFEWMDSSGYYSRVEESYVIVEYDPDKNPARAYVGDWIIFGEDGFDVRSTTDLTTEFKTDKKYKTGGV